VQRAWRAGGLNLAAQRAWCPRAVITAFAGRPFHAGEARTLSTTCARRLGEERAALRGGDVRLRLRTGAFSDRGLVLALIAGGGGLPQRVVRRCPTALVCAYEDRPVGLVPIWVFRFEDVGSPFLVEFASRGGHAGCFCARCAPVSLIRQARARRCLWLPVCQRRFALVMTVLSCRLIFRGRGLCRGPHMNLCPT